MGDNQVIGVLLDTNVLLYTYDGLDIFEKILNFLNYKPIFYIHEKVLEELNNIEKSNKNRKVILSRVNLARLLLEKYKNWWRVISDDSTNIEKIDDKLINTCLKYNLWLVTSDYKLRLRALERGVVVLYVVKRTKRLILEYPEKRSLNH